jgi:hypothetical protein
MTEVVRDTLLAFAVAGALVGLVCALAALGGWA